MKRVSVPQTKLSFGVIDALKRQITPLSANVFSLRERMVLKRHIDMMRENARRCETRLAKPYVSTVSVPEIAVCRVAARAKRAQEVLPQHAIGTQSLLRTWRSYPNEHKTQYADVLSMERAVKRMRRACINRDDFTIEDDTIVGYVGKTGRSMDLLIPDNIAVIGDNAFKDCDFIKSVEIPEGVTSIGCNAFENCTKLSRIVLPASLEFVGTAAFGGCGSIKEVCYNGSIEDWCAVTFEHYDSNPMDYMPEERQKILSAKRAFCIAVGEDEYQEVTEIRIPDTVESIGDYAFSGFASVTELEIADSVTQIGEYAFWGTAVEEVYIPDSVTAIGEFAFAGCWRLCTVEIGGCVSEIGEAPFDGCDALETVILPKAYCRESNIEEIFGTDDPYFTVLCRIDENTTAEVTLDGFMINDGILIAYTGEDTDVEVPEDVIEISEKVFANSEVESVELPDGLERIGDYAFWASNIEEIVIPDSVTVIANGAFYDCGGLESVEIPYGVEEIGDGAFYGCESLTSIEIPDSVEEIGNEVFEGCTSLEEVTMPEHLMDRIKDAFGAERAHIRFTFTQDDE